MCVSSVAENRIRVIGGILGTWLRPQAMLDISDRRGETRKEPAWSNAVQVFGSSMTGPLPFPEA